MADPTDDIYYQRLLDDIPFTVAQAAHTGTSFSPEKRAETERADYAATLSRDLAALRELAQAAPDPDAALDRLDDEWPRYRTSYRDRYLFRLQRMSRCVSTMIAGTSNFPLTRAQKASDSADRATREVVEYRERALAAIRRIIRPDLQPIMSGDADAAERLRAEIAKAEAEQVRMKTVNAAIRKHAKAGTDAQVAALTALGYSKVFAGDLLKPDFAGRIGFADYQLKNNGAEIRRLKARLAQVEASRATPATTSEGATGVKLEDDPPANRVRLFFPGKPPAEVRERLKRGGFRWAPTVGAWQAYRNPAATILAHEIVGQIVRASDGETTLNRDGGEEARAIFQKVKAETPYRADPGDEGEEPSPCENCGGAVRLVTRGDSVGSQVLECSSCGSEKPAEEEPCSCAGDCAGCSGGMLKRDCPCGDCKCAACLTVAEVRRG